jgi:hypothetical protein
MRDYSCGTPFIPNETFNSNYYHSGQDVLFGPDQYISCWMKVDILFGTILLRTRKFCPIMI